VAAFSYERGCQGTPLLWFLCTFHLWQIRALLLSQGGPGGPTRPPWYPVEPSPDRERDMGTEPALVPGPLARL
jgi:hypothetical protein